MSEKVIIYFNVGGKRRYVVQKSVRKDNLYMVETELDKSKALIFPIAEAVEVLNRIFNPFDRTYLYEPVAEELKTHMSDAFEYSLLIAIEDSSTLSKAEVIERVKMLGNIKMRDDIVDKKALFITEGSSKAIKRRNHFK